MEAKQESYTLNTYDPISLTIQSYNKTITHYGSLEPFIVNVNDNVDLMTKSAMDEFILSFERRGYCFPSDGCWLAVKDYAQQESPSSLEDLSHDHVFFAYLAFGQIQNIKINTETVLRYLNSQKGGFPFKHIYRLMDHSIIHPSMLSLFKRRYEKHPEESRRLFYLLRCFDFNPSMKGSIVDISPFTSSYFQLFLSVLMKIEDAGYEVDDKLLRTIGAIEFEIRDLPELDRISQLIKETLESEEFTLATGHQLVVSEAVSQTNQTIPF